MSTASSGVQPQRADQASAAARDQKRIVVVDDDQQLADLMREFLLEEGYAVEICSQGDQAFCFLVEGGKAVRTPVRVGFRDGDFVEVMQRRAAGKDAEWQDFSGAEVFIIGNLSALADGQSVEAVRQP